MSFVKIQEIHVHGEEDQPNNNHTSHCELMLRQINKIAAGEACQDHNTECRMLYETLVALYKNFIKPAYS